MSAFGKADIRGLLPKPQPGAHFYELGLVEDGVEVKTLGDYLEGERSDHNPRSEIQ